MNWFNQNTMHNVLNMTGLITGALMVFDWTALGVTPQQMGVFIGMLALIKLVANAARDGVDGMIKQQPPVADQIKTVSVTAPADAKIEVKTPPAS